MTTFAITAQYPIFADADGTPLENGYVYIGEENKNPVTDPITVYWDEDLSNPATQPVRTLAGAPNRNGSPSQLYCGSDFSILIQDKNQKQIYYSKTGIKNYLTASFGDFNNYAPNGRFVVKQLNEGTNYTGRNADRWQEVAATYGMLTDRVDMAASTISFVKPEIAYYCSLSVNGLPTAVTSDYAKFSAVVEDVNTLQGQQVTLSWYAQGAGLLERYAVSMTLIDEDGNATDIGIGKKIFLPNDEWTRESITVTMPDRLFTDLNKEDFFKTGTIINFWLAAGSDYDAETGGLGNFTADGIVGNINIADVRINKGALIIDGNDLSFDQELAVAKRYFERSHSYSESATVPTSGVGYITYIASGASTTIPGFRFNVEKRTETPTVRIYPHDSSTAGSVTHDGVGTVAVASINDITSTGVGTITLAAPTVDGGVYKYHYVVDDEYSL